MGPALGRGGRRRGEGRPGDASVGLGGDARSGAVECRGRPPLAPRGARGHTRAATALSVPDNARTSTPSRCVRWCAAS